MTITINLSEVEAAALHAILSDKTACVRALRAKTPKSPYKYSLEQENPYLTVDILKEEVLEALDIPPAVLRHSMPIETRNL